MTTDMTMTSHVPATIRVKSKPFFTDFLWTWFGSVANPTYCLSWERGTRSKVDIVKFLKSRHEVNEGRMVFSCVHCFFKPEVMWLAQKSWSMRSDFESPAVYLYSADCAGNWPAVRNSINRDWAWRTLTALTVMQWEEKKNVYQTD